MQQQPVREYEIGPDGQRGRELKPGAARPMPGPAQSKRRGMPTAMVSGKAMELALIVTMQVAAWLLIVLSVIGTFYGVQGRDAPLTAPWRVAADVAALPTVAIVALLGQGLPALLQWGSSGMARDNWRWWSLYVIALGLSLWWNWEAYGSPLLALGVPSVLAGGLVLGGDLFPELVLVKRR